jgi:hypothetical protein
MIATVAFTRLRQCARLSMRSAAVAAAMIANGQAQPPPSGGQVLVPGSSLEKPGDIALRPHTNTLIFVPSAIATVGRSPAGRAAPARPAHLRKKPARSTIAR